MSIRRCDAGEHTYDDSQHSSCPYCRKTRLTTPPGGGGSGMPPGGMDTGGGLPPTEAPRAAQNKTTPAPGMSGSKKSSKTHIVIGGGAGETIDFGDVMPVVGWLVVIEGEGQGHDLRITPGMNSIGRNEGDILLNFGESSVSREKHAYVAYDADENNFVIAHGEGKNLTKVNGKMIMGTQVLNPYDRIKIGKTELLFIPLCGDSFVWGDSAEVDT